MTDEILPPVQQPEPQKAWVRCPTCSEVMPNITIAKDGHRLNCPHDIKLAIQKIEVALEALKGQLGGVAGQVTSISAEPSIDMMGIADWDDDTSDEHVIVEQTPTGAVTIPRIPSPYDDEDGDGYQSVR